MMTEDTAQGFSRRNFIKGVVAAGAVASSSAYLFRSTPLHGQPSGAGSVERLLTLRVGGKKVVTIEGLADPATGKLSAVQQGVVNEQGFQCAFCMPGFVMAATGYLKPHPTPTRAELAHGVSGNLCRCQDYDKILTALMRGAEHMRNA